MIDVALPNFGARLKRLRRILGLKQVTVADFAGVCQTTISRWESGAIAPDAALGLRVLNRLSRPISLNADRAIRSLVENASCPVHLVTDLDHRLLAASATRERQWQRSSAELFGRSLWRFASRPIEDAEQRLEAEGWWHGATAKPIVITLEEANNGLRIAPGQLHWERLHLADGTPVRLCTSA